MGNDASATTSATTGAAAAENEPEGAAGPAAAEGADAADPGCWEFRLTADRRRILIPVKRTTDPGFV